MKTPTRKCLVCKKRFEVKSNEHWICSFECAKVKNAAVDKQKEKIKKTDWTEKKAKMKINTHSKEHKKNLQDEINKLSRMIDIAQGFTKCIDCGLELTINTQTDACHLHSRSKNSTLKWNLHNLHSGHNHCNVWNPKHECNYKAGLEKRYGRDYLLMAENLKIQYPVIHLKNFEIKEKLALVRKIIRNFNTYTFANGTSARNIFNLIIGIYK